MKAETLTAFFILLLLAVVLIVTDIPGRRDVLLDGLVFVLVGGTLAFQVWLRARLFR